VAVREREKERKEPLRLLGQTEERPTAWLGCSGRKEGRWGVWVSFFFKTFSFKTLSKLKLFSNFKHFKPFQNFQIILKKLLKLHTITHKHHATKR
jgi:hypothetical protein